VVVTKARNFFDHFRTRFIPHRGLGSCASLDGDRVHFERQALRAHPLSIYRSLLFGDDTSGARARFRPSLGEHLHVDRTCPTDTHGWVAISAGF